MSGIGYYGIQGIANRRSLDSDSEKAGGDAERAFPAFLLYNVGITMCIKEA